MPEKIEKKIYLRKKGSAHGSFYVHEPLSPEMEKDLLNCLRLKGFFERRLNLTTQITRFKKL